MLTKCQLWPVSNTLLYPSLGFWNQEAGILADLGGLIASATMLRGKSASTQGQQAWPGDRVVCPGGAKGGHAWPLSESDHPLPANGRVEDVSESSGDAAWSAANGCC